MKTVHTRQLYSHNIVSSYAGTRRHDDVRWERVDTMRSMYVRNTTEWTNTIHIHSHCDCEFVFCCEAQVVRLSTLVNGTQSSQINIFLFVTLLSKRRKLYFFLSSLMWVVTIFFYFDRNGIHSKCVNEKNSSVAKYDFVSFFFFFVFLITFGENNNSFVRVRVCMCVRAQVSRCVCVYWHAHCHRVLLERKRESGTFDIAFGWHSFRTESCTKQNNFFFFLLRHLNTRCVCVCVCVFGYSNQWQPNFLIDLCSSTIFQMTYKEWKKKRKNYVCIQKQHICSHSVRIRCHKHTHTHTSSSTTYS